MNKRIIGIYLAIFSTVFWGLNGAITQLLLEKGMSATWLITFRTTTSGLLMLLISWIMFKNKIFKVWTNKFMAFYMVIFAIVGVYATQITYILAIDNSNAAIASILQSLNILFVVSYVTVKKKSLPRRLDVLGTILALLGVFLITTHGNINQLLITPAGLIWGLLTAITTTVYTLMPQKLMKEYGAITTISWSLFIAGIIGNIVFPINTNMPTITVTDISSLIYIVLFGTIGAYLLYISSLKWISPNTLALLATFEPLTATVVAVFALHTPYGIIDWIGTALILLMIVLQSFAE